MTECRNENADDCEAAASEEDCVIEEEIEPPKQVQLEECNRYQRKNLFESKSLTNLKHESEFLLFCFHFFWRSVSYFWRQFRIILSFAKCNCFRANSQFYIFGANFQIFSAKKFEKKTSIVR